MYSNFTHKFQDVTNFTFCLYIRGVMLYSISNPMTSHVPLCTWSLPSTWGINLVATSARQTSYAWREHPSIVLPIVLVILWEGPDVQ